VLAYPKRHPVVIQSLVNSIREFSSNPGSFRNVDYKVLRASTVSLSPRRNIPPFHKDTGIRSQIHLPYMDLTVTLAVLSSSVE
jgi:hypothetical protein